MSHAASEEPACGVAYLLLVHSGEPVGTLEFGTELSLKTQSDGSSFHPTRLNGRQVGVWRQATPVGGGKGSVCPTATGVHYIKYGVLNYLQLTLSRVVTEGRSSYHSPTLQGLQRAAS
ncbi:hypothetical protein J6590_045766 [Homalodisca vitripennis]|nr:hypothetical protein J6590_045766 [Homalodisca vitripennis]